MNNNSNIYVFDMGGVITKPSKTDMIYYGTGKEIK